MSNWKEVTEEGQVFWINDELGNVVKAGDDIYIALLPKVIRLGPFRSLEDAQRALQADRTRLNQLLDEFNQSLSQK